MPKGGNNIKETLRAEEFCLYVYRKIKVNVSVAPDLRPTGNSGQIVNADIWFSRCREHDEDYLSQSQQYNES